jgi:hypothetical protein
MSNAVWQKCPICDGNGCIYTSTVSLHQSECPACEGQRIISVVDGRPPAKKQPRCKCCGPCHGGDGFVQDCLGCKGITHTLYITTEAE